MRSACQRVKYHLRSVTFLLDGTGSHPVLVGYLFVSMDILSGSAVVSSEWLKEHRAWLSNPCSRRPYETQEVDNDKEMSTRFSNVFDTVYVMNHRCSAVIWARSIRVRLVVRALSARSSLVFSPCQRVKHRKAPLHSCQFLFGWWGISSSFRGLPLCEYERHLWTSRRVR